VTSRTVVPAAVPPDSESAPGRAGGRRVWRDALVVLAVALGFGFLEAWQGRLLFHVVSPRLFWPEALVRTLPCWVALAALVPPTLWIARRVPVQRHTWPVAVPIHIVAGTVWVCVHIGLSAVLIELIRNRPAVSAVDVFIMIFSRYAVMDFFTYCGIVAAHHAIHSQAEARDRAVAASELSASLARARLEALRAQLDPHFLFNALNSISVLALQGHKEAVVQTVSCLGDVLRISLGEGGEQEIPLAAELEFLDRYLELERVRLGDRLTVERRIDPATLDALVPSLLLQPLVENAIRHGIAARRGAGRIVVEATREADRLRVEVRDSGPGFESGDAPREGIGLANTRARLEQLHGGAQSLEIGAAPEGGARITVRLPFRTAPSRTPAK
jgi:hypothetical protein